MIEKLSLWCIFCHLVVSQKKVGDMCLEEYTGSTGICMLSEHCPTARAALDKNGILPTFCRHAFDEPIVCCRYSDYVTSMTTQLAELPVLIQKSNIPVVTNTNEGSKRVSERKCEEYRQYVSSHPSAMPNIIGGDPAGLKEFPHMVAIGWLNFEDTYSFNCGGTLISPLWVLTAGHCSSSPAARVRAPAVARLGATYIDTEDDAHVIPIESINRHPSYAPPLRYHDICLIKLARPTDLSAAIQPACLWDREQLMHTEAVAIGWGINNVRTRQGSNVLQKVTLTLEDSEECDRSLTMFRNRNWAGIIPGQLCAGGVGKDTCQGDSGAPLQVKWNDKFYVIGITSFGLNNDCAESGRPAVYTRVSNYVGWIEETVWKE